MASGRRPTTGSRSAPSSGSAAPDHDDDSRFTATAADVSSVLAGLPAELRRRLDRVSRFAPLSVTTAIRAELQRGLSVQRLIERAEYRWQQRYSEAHHQNLIGRPIGVAEALIRNDCTSSACDDGIDLWTGKKCPACQPIDRVGAQREGAA